MIEIKPLEAVTRLTMDDRGPSPVLRMSLKSDDISRLSEYLAQNGQRLIEVAEALADGAQLEDAADEAVSLYRSVIDIACGQHASGKLVKWMAGGQEVSSLDLAIRLSPVVGWVSERYAEAFDGAAGQDG